MKLQIAFDYLMVFAFVLLIFSLLFISISGQRATFSNQQSFAELQVVAQTVASEITAASAAGNGYNQSFLLPPGISLLQYNISVTKQGTVIVASNVFGQVSHAVASTSASVVLSNQSYISSNGKYYVIPTSSGVGYINLQNSFGTICIDLVCPSSANEPAQISMHANVTHALYLNGYNSYVSKDTGSGIPPGPAQSVSLWFRPASLSNPGTRQYLVDEGNFLNSPSDWVAIDNGNVIAGTTAADYCRSSIALSAGRWYLMTYTFDGANLRLYINGSIALGCSDYGIASASPISINLGRSAAGTDLFNGTMADVQVYGDVLRSAQASQIYHGGITAGPVQPNILMWLPLGGNAHNYGGAQSDPVQYGPSLYPAVAYISVPVKNNMGGPSVGSTVGFSTSLGNFSSGGSLSTSTGTNGVAVAVLNQGLGSGIATVKSTAFNGNESSSVNLIGWWPLNLGQGPIAYNLAKSGSDLSGNMVYASWASPNLAASFSGQGYIQIPSSLSLQSQITVSAWVRPAGQQPSRFGGMLTGLPYYSIGVCGYLLSVCYYNLQTGQSYTSRVNLSPGTWYMVTAVMSGSSESIYVNGILALSISSELSGDVDLGLNDIGSGPCCSQFFNGSISNVQLYGSLFTQQQVLQMYQEGIGGAPVLGIQSNLAAWYPLDGDAINYVQAAPQPASGIVQYNGIIYGNVRMTPADVPYHQASPVLAALLSANQISGIKIPFIPNSISGNISISTWAYVSGATSSNQCQGIFGDEWPNHGSGFQLLGSGSSTCGIFYVDNQAVPWPSGSNYALPTGKWIYLVATYNGKTGNASVYLNNVLFASKTLQPGLDVGQSAPYSIGTTWQTGAPASFYEYLANLQLYSSVLGAGQMSRLYYAGMASLPAQGHGLLAWYPLDGNSNDYSSYGNDGSAENVVYNLQIPGAPQSTPSFSGSGAYFSGSGGHIIISNSVPLSGGLTASAWIYPASRYNAGNNRQVIMGEGSSYELSVNYYHNMEGDFWVWTGSAWKVVSTTSRLSTGSWYMLTGTYNGLNMSIYVNGVLSNTIAQTGVVQNPDQPTVIGSYESPPYSDYYFNGTISDVQLYGTSLSEQQISQLYNGGAPQSQSMSVPMGLIT
ncbi:LamG domain-containing protein [Candidatus Marsarchaeota archaeon]|nr:LamG domain-containing protein [Candidatus Marsarchaeota archaeon]